MSARTLNARFPGECRGRCGSPIVPGDLIVNLGRGRNFHVNCNDPGGSEVVEIFFPSTGNRAFRNRNGRCEDAPCCGCCTC